MAKYNRLFEKYGHDCEMVFEQDVITTSVPGNSLRARFLRNFILFTTVSELNSNSKLYLRSQAAIAREKNRHLQNFRYVIHPFSDARMTWQFIMTFTYFISIILFSYATTFGNENFFSDAPLQISCILVNVICWIDIVTNFNTGFRDTKTKEIILERKKIIKNYVRTYFFIDFFSSMALIVMKLFQYINCTSICHVILQLMSFLKIFRIPTIFEYKQSVVEALKLNFTTVSVILLLTFFLLYVHIVACAMFYIANFRKPLFLPYQNTFTKDNGTRVNEYAKAFFVASCIITESGNIPKDKESEEIIFTILIWILSKVLSILYVAQLMQIVQSVTSSRAKYHEMVRQLREYMCHKQLPLSMQRRLLQYYEFRFQKSYFRESEILSTISGQLRQEIVLHSCRQLVENVTFFNNLPLSLLVRIVSCLRSEVFLTNDVIIRANTTGDAMYFIASGTVAIFTSSGKEVCHLEDGSHFGEVALVMKDEKRIASVVAVEICELYRLDRKDFVRAIHPYPDLLENIEHIAIERLERTNLLDEQHKRLLAERMFKA